MEKIRQLGEVAAVIALNHLPEVKLTLPYLREPAIELSFYLNSELGLWLGYNERNFISEWKSLVNSGDVIFDIGAYIGTYSLLAVVNAGVTAHAFEAHPETAKRLSDHAELNGVSDRMMSKNFAITDEVGQRDFYIDPESARRNSFIQPSTESEALVVECTTVDDYCDEEQVIPDIVKIDVEGAGAEVLRGASQIVQNHSIRWVIEIHNESEKTTFQNTFNDGYKIEQLSAKHLLAVPVELS